MIMGESGRRYVSLPQGAKSHVRVQFVSRGAINISMCKKSGKGLR